jgi:septal ring factor EnvC (AmiA/AmiB activator)
VSGKEMAMWKMMGFVSLLTVGLLAAGCVNVKADASGLGKSSERTAAPPPNAAADSRSVADLQRENAQLRDRLNQLEKDRQAWQSTVDRQKDEIHALKQQRENLEKERDRYKKALKKDD